MLKKTFKRKPLLKFVFLSCENEQKVNCMKTADHLLETFPKWLYTSMEGMKLRPSFVTSLSSTLLCFCISESFLGKGSNSFVWEMAEELAVNSEPYHFEPTFLQLAKSNTTKFYF